MPAEPTTAKDDAPLAAGAPRRPGRPRDPRLDSTLRNAAAIVFAREGWVGFTFEAIAREAHVGKSAIYRRWRSREELLLDAINQVEPLEMHPELSFRDAVFEVAKDHVGWWAGATGAAYLRLQTEQLEFPFLGALHQARVRVPYLEFFRRLVDAAIASGELPSGASSTMLLEALSGSLMARMTALNELERRALVDDPDRYCNRLAEFLTAGLVAAALQSSEPPSPLAVASRETV